MKTAGQRVREEREAYGWSRKTLSAKTGISETAISDFELGYTKKSLSLHHLAAALNRRIEYLETGKGPKIPDDSEKWADITAYGQQAAAGDGMNPEEYEDTHSLKFKRSSLQKKGLFARKLSIFYANGDSMEPRIHDGDALLFDGDDTKPKDGAIYVVRYDGGYYVKRLHQYGSQWFLVSDNAADPKWKKPVLVDFDNDFEVLGRVRWIGSWED